MPERVKELYDQMVEYQKSILEKTGDGSLRSTIILAAAFIVAAIETPST